MSRLLPAAGLVAGVILLCPASPAADWPQWMGPNRDGVWPETGVVQTLPPGGPPVKWRTPIGQGYAGPAVAGGKVYVTDKKLKEGVVEPKDPFAKDIKVPSVERVLCLDEATGKEVWKHEYDVVYTISYPYGPRCTPTVSGGKVYTLGAMGDLFCLDAAKGTVRWQKNFPKDYQAKTPFWGYAGHPLVYKDLLICVAGGKNALIVAFNKDTGAEVWKALETPEFPVGPGYSPPTIIEAGGVTQLVLYHSKGVTSFDPLTGKQYWTEANPTYMGMAIMVPRKEGDLLFASGAFEHGVVLKLDKDKPGASAVWKTGTGQQPTRPSGKGLSPINMTPWVEGGVAYGVDNNGAFRAVKVETGERLWSTFKPVFGKEKDDDFKGGGSGTAFVVKNGDRFFLFSETGELAVAKLGPKGYEELGRAKLLNQTGKSFGRDVVWSHPAFADKCVFARNDEEIVCADLSAK